jgi:hypothetical protein
MEVRNEQRRQRVFRRHHLSRTAGGGLEAVTSVAALHSSDPATPYLGLWARVAGFETEHLDSLLLEERSLWRLHAMRRTLFVVPTSEAGAYLEGAAREIAAKERRRLLGWLEVAVDSPDDWLTRRGDEVAELLGGGAELSTQEIAQAIPALDVSLRVGSGKWATTTPAVSRVVYQMAMEGRIVRTGSAGSWRSSQYRWAAATEWHHEPVDRPEPTEARTRILSSYLRSHGPATMTDLRWWTGWTVANLRAALSALDVAEVELESGGTGLILEGDTEFEIDDDPGVAFLPSLDPTPMGWKERGWYLGPHGASIFDRNGNAGPTIWSVAGIIGGWSQAPNGTVLYRLLEPVDDTTAELALQTAASLTAWLDGTVVTPRFRTPLEKDLANRKA